MNRKQQQHLHLGGIRMSPLMFGSLRYIASRHQNGTLNLEEISELKQTQLRSFKTHEWIVETTNRLGIAITPKGRQALKSFQDNNEFFRNVSNMSFSSLLNLEIPDNSEPQRIHPLSERNTRRKNQAA